MDERVDIALGELRAVASRIDGEAVARACEMIAEARRVVLYGCGREGLQLRGFAMRLHHLGRAVAMQGDMAAPPVGPGDLLIVSAGPGELATVTALMRVAGSAGASILFLTAQPETPSAALASHVLTIPAQTMADDQVEADDQAKANDPAKTNDQHGAARSVLPMGSVYEGALFLLFEIMVLMLRDRLGISPEAMRANHTNLE